MPLVGKDRTLFKVFGIPIRVNPSWVFLLGLIVWSLARGYFPEVLEEAGRAPVSPRTYWLLGLLGALGLFSSLLVHEICHSLVARWSGIRVSGITLFVFGGVSQLEEEPRTALTELVMAAVGPISSILIGCFFLALSFLGGSLRWPAPVTALLKYLMIINFFLALFNSLPAFPLDGGRVARSILWGLTGDLSGATRVAAAIGSFFGLGMIVFGMAVVFLGFLIVGIWFSLIGLFLYQAARSSLRHVAMRDGLEGENVSRLMTRDPVTVPPELSIEDFVSHYVLNYRLSFFPVVDSSGNLVGTVHVRAVKRIPREQWVRATVAEVMVGATEEIALRPDTDAVEALCRLSARDGVRLVVVERGRPVGIVSLRDLMEFLALKADLTPRR